MAEKPTSDHSSQKFKPSSHPPPPTQLPNPTLDADHPKKVGPLKSSATHALTISIPTAPSTVFSGQPTFSQLLAGAMSGSPLENSSLSFQVPMVAVPYFVSPVGLIESPSMTGHFGMTHQAVLASVTAHAQMQLQMGRASSSPRPTLHAISSPSSTISQQKKLESDVNISTPTTGEQKSPSSQIVVKATSTDGYNWRKYGQKQVKVSENSRSYYRCTHSNCLAKKKVEHCQDGHVAEIVYRGQHSHFPPEKIRSSRERGSPIGSAAKDDHSMDFQSAELANSDNLLAKNDEQTCPAEGDPDPCPTKDDQRPCPAKGDPYSCLTKNDQHPCPAKLDLDPYPANNDQHPEHGTPKELPRSSDCKVDPNTNSNEAHAGPDHKRSKLCDVPVAYEPSLFKSVREGKVVVRHSYDEGPPNDGYRWRKYGQKIVKGNPNPRSYFKCSHMGCQVRKHVERAEDVRVIITTYEGHHNHDIPPPRSSIDSPASRPDHELKHQSHPLDKALVCFSDSRTSEYEEKQKESDQFELDMEPEPNTEDIQYRKMDPAAESSLSASAVHSKKRKTTDGPALSSKIIFTTPLLLSNQPHEPDAQHTAAIDEMQELLFRERTRMALDINPAYISRLENRRELGFYTNPANQRLAFTTLDLNVTEFRRCITQVLTCTLHVRYYDRSNLRDSEITAEMAIVVPLTVSACMCAVYSKLRAIHHTHGRLSTRYPTPPHYNKEIELPLPLAIAIQELGIFQTASLSQNVILAPTYPEATQYEGRAEDQFNITDYQTYIPVFKDLGIPCKSVDPNIKKGSAWWTYHIRNSEGTTDLICTIPPTCYTELAASLRMLFLATQQDNTLCSEIVTWPTELPDYGTHLRESPPNSNTRAFLALCHGPKEEWSLGHA